MHFLSFSVYFEMFHSSKKKKKDKKDNAVSIHEATTQINI